MTRLFNRHALVCCLCSITAFVVTASLSGVEPAGKAESSDSAQAGDSAIQKADVHMRQCEMRLADELQQPVDRIDHALLVFGDSARGNTNGTLWAYGKSGRPLAFLELYKGADANASWCHAVTLTGTQRVTLKTPLGNQWQPGSIQIEPVALSNVAPPDARETTRLRQLKDLCRKFTAHEFWDPDNSRFELRPLVKPVCRYDDPGNKIHDGAVFAFANGTNPEVLLLLEAVGNDLKSARWQYSLARLGSAEIHVALDGKEVWKRERTPRVVGEPGDPYWLFMSGGE